MSKCNKEKKKHSKKGVLTFSIIVEVDLGAYWREAIAVVISEILLRTERENVAESTSPNSSLPLTVADSFILIVDEEEIDAILRGLV